MEITRNTRRSPFNLLQEIYSPDEWRIFVCCMMLNQTTRRQVDRVRGRFFKLWPDAKSACNADVDHMSYVIQSLGLSNRRSSSIIKMSHDYLMKDWKEPIELYGLGKYAQDSYDIFIRGVFVENPTDKFLKKYLDWKMS
jgi:methyl-CpG-binding domain protein 4